MKLFLNKIFDDQSVKKHGLDIKSLGQKYGIKVVHIPRPKIIEIWGIVQKEPKNKTRSTNNLSPYLNLCPVLLCSMYVV